MQPCSQLQLSHMAGFLAALSYLALLFSVEGGAQSTDFLYNGFKGAANVSFDGSAGFTSNGVLQLTNDSRRLIGHAFYSSPVRMLRNASAGPTPISFSTTFVLDIVTLAGGGGDGLTFFLAPQKALPGAENGEYLGLFGVENNGNFSNHVVAIEFDTVQAIGPFTDPNDNHVGVDINSLESNATMTAAYYTSDSKNVSKNVTVDLAGGQPVQAWVDYDGATKLLDVTISPLSVPKPRRPLITYHVDLSVYLKEYMYVGFSAATGKLSSYHYILGWSFRTEGVARSLDTSRLPLPPKIRAAGSPVSRSRVIKIGAIFTIVTLFLAVLAISTWWYMRQRAKLNETLEEWELDYPHRFPYKDLYKATKGFKETELLGVGGFGKVYKGSLRLIGEEVAIKKISSNSRQGVREFIAEVSSLGRMRHRHLVQLQGWCKRNEDLLLVYEFMPNGSLDMFLYDEHKGRQLSWDHRFKVLKGIASGLLYLHEDWEQLVVHRDIKSSNVLLDADMNGKLGDFGLAKLYEHGRNPQTTRVVGTLGYIAPELSRTGKATPSSDVFAYGMLLLEVATGRTPIDPDAPTRELVLLDWVRDCKLEGTLLEVVDPRLEGLYVKKEMELVLDLGLVCCQSSPDVRPTMRQVTNYLNGDDSLSGAGTLVFTEADPFEMASRIPYFTSYGFISSGSIHAGR